MLNRGMVRAKLVLLVMTLPLIFFFVMRAKEENKKVTRIVETVNNVSLERKNCKTLSKEGKEAYQKLLKAQVFEDTWIGYDGHLSPNVKAFRTILAEESADEVFKKLLREAQMPGQLYALCGVYFTDSKYFCSVIEKYRNNQENVKTFSSCVLNAYKVSNIVESKAHFISETPLSERNLELFMKYRSMNNASEPTIDIVTGYLPLSFRD